MRPRRIVHSSGAEHCLVVPSPDRAAPRIWILMDAGLFSWPAGLGLKEQATRLDGVRECLKARTVGDDCLKTRAVKEGRQYKKEVEGRISLFYSFYMLVCISYAVCMHSRMHTFSCPQPYSQAKLSSCMHCMQSFPELCSCIACIGWFLTAYNAYKLEKRGSDPDPKKQAMRFDGRFGWLDGVRTCPETRTVKNDCLKRGQ